MREMWKRWASPAIRTCAGASGTRARGATSGAACTGEEPKTDLRVRAPSDALTPEARLSPENATPSAAARNALATRRLLTAAHGNARNATQNARARQRDVQTDFSIFVGRKRALLAPPILAGSVL